MLEYKISDKTKEEMKKDLHVVKSAIATIANIKFGIIDKPAEGIYKCGGGVRVNGKSIVIKPWCVVERDGDNDAIPEEYAVIDAIYQVCEILNSKGIEGLDNYEPCFIGDPLYDLVGL